MSETNPLLDLGFEIPFDRILPAHVEPAIHRLLADAKKIIEDIAGFEGERTYDNTLSALDDGLESLELAMTVVGHLESVVTEPALREAYNKTRPEVSAFYASIPLHAGLWSALSAYAETAEAKALTGAKKRHLDKTLDDFRRHGAELDDEGKKRLEALSRELSTVTMKYGENVLDATKAWELVITDEGKLAGLPESAKEQAKASAEEKGQDGWRFTLQAPSVIGVLTYLDDREIREKVYRAYSTRGSKEPFDNLPLIKQILSLRRDQAKLLGYADFADFVLEDRMAKSGAEAWRFVRSLEERARPALEREARELLDFRRELEGEDAEPIAPWDLGYYAEKLRKARFDFDEEALRPYFPAEQTLKGVFSIAERLYRIKVEPTDELPTWHQDVRTFRVTDEAGAKVGAFYVDLYPRESKRGGAWMNGLISGAPDSHGVFEPHLGLMAANFSPPTKNKPSLLTHDEVQTLFHEFGHLLHHLLSKVEVKALSGTNVAWDFVELPSQIMENWAFEKEALDLFARHYETNELIPADLFSKLQRTRTFREGSATMRQLSFATLDLELHTRIEDLQSLDIRETARKVLQRFSPVELPPEYALVANFGHLFSSSVGYAAGYYSYKWAEVLDADAFTRFQAEGVFSAEVGTSFKTNILERGDSEEPMELYKRFMGREPTVDALIARAGL